MTLYHVFAETRQNNTNDSTLERLLVATDNHLSINSEKLNTTWGNTDRRIIKVVDMREANSVEQDRWSNYMTGEYTQAGNYDSDFDVQLYKDVMSRAENPATSPDYKSYINLQDSPKEKHPDDALKDVSNDMEVIYTRYTDKTDPNNTLSATEANATPTSDPDSNLTSKIDEIANDTQASELINVLTGIFKEYLTDLKSGLDEYSSYTDFLKTKKSQNDQPNSVDDEDIPF
jgi:hypothetical protein